MTLALLIINAVVFLAGVIVGIWVGRRAMRAALNDAQAMLAKVQTVYLRHPLTEIVEWVREDNFWRVATIKSLPRRPGCWLVELKLGGVGINAEVIESGDVTKSADRAMAAMRRATN